MSTSKTEIRDQDLMRLYDGELDEGRAEEIEAWLAEGEDEDALDKLAGLDLAGELLAEAVDGDERADDVVDAVMAELDDAVSEDDEGADEEGSKDVEAELVPLKQPSAQKPSTANDNASRIYMLAAVAAAAAAGLFVWGNQGRELEPPPHAHVSPPPTATVEATARPRAPIAPAPTVAGAEEEEDGVEIAAVDFGTHRGSVFYVGDASAGRTAVVWINDAGEP